MALFRIYVERIDGPLHAEHPDSLTFQARNHDDILEIARRVRHLPGMEPDETAALAVGMKLFSEVMLKYRKEPMFANLLPHFREFVGGFKNAVRAAQSASEEPATAH